MDPAAVFCGVFAADKADFLHTIDEADGAVVGHAELFGEFADGHPVATGKALDGEEGLVLLGGYAVADGGGLAESEELAQGVAEFGKEFVVFFAEISCRSFEERHGDRIIENRHE